MILEIGQLMTVFTVHHTTTYRYRQPVRLGPHQLMFRPRDSFDQRLLDCQLKVTPEPVDIRWIHDVFGNCVTLVDFNSSCQVLEFETSLLHDPAMLPRLLRYLTLQVSEMNLLQQRGKRHEPELLAGLFETPFMEAIA